MHTYGERMVTFKKKSFWVGSADLGSNRSSTPQKPGLSAATHCRVLDAFLNFCKLQWVVILQMRLQHVVILQMRLQRVVILQMRLQILRRYYPSPSQFFGRGKKLLGLSLLTFPFSSTAKPKACQTGDFVPNFAASSI